MAFDQKTLLLYAITDRAWLNGRKMEDDVRDVLQGGATFLQLREKHLTGDALLEEALAVQKVAKEFGVPFVLDDDVELAKKIDADGVHVGQSDMEYTEARRILGPDKIIGVSCGNVEEAKAAEAVGADYIGVGAVFPTSTKESEAIGPEQVKVIADSVSIPTVAIGGINIENEALLKGTDIVGICAISALFGAEDREGATKKMLEIAKTVVE